MSNTQSWRQSNAPASIDSFLLRALDHSRVCIAVQNADLEYLFVLNLPDCWTIDDGGPVDDVHIFGAELTDKLASVKKAAQSTGGSDSFEAVVADERVFEFRIEAISPDGGDEAKRDIVTTIVELSEERRRERILKSLLREVSHRSKNMLAIVQSIASQTARHEVSVGTFLSKFRGRIQSLASSQDLITDSDWRGAMISDLVRKEAGKYVADQDRMIRFSGDNIRLSPNAALHVGLALHELVVNSVAHGALAGKVEPIKVECRVERDGEQRIVRIEWDEMIDNPSAAEAASAKERHFGSVVLERVAPSAVAGDADYRISPSRIRYRLTFPVGPPEMPDDV